MIEIEDLKKVKLEDGDILIFQLNDGMFHHKNYRIGLYEYIRRIIRNNDFLILPASVKINVVNGMVNIKDLELLEDSSEEKSILFDPKDLNPEWGKKMAKKTVIVRNRAKCKRCRTIIESKSRHDFVECDCRSIFVDGGKDYLRRGGDRENIIELSETKEV